MSDLMRDRYGTDRPVRRRTVILASGLIGVVAMSWLAWAVWFQSTPDVQSALSNYVVTGQHSATARVEVKFRSTDIHASCTLRAYAFDHTVVGELSFVPPTGHRTLSLKKTLRTERLATSVDLVGCTTARQHQPK